MPVVPPLQPTPIILLLLDCTWADKASVRPSKRSIIQALDAVLDPSVIPIYGAGVGAKDFLVDRLIGGGTAVGIDTCLLRVFQELARRYNPGDRLAIVGASRGSWNARVLATLISDVGIPRRDDSSGNTDDACRELYKRYLTGELSDPTHAAMAQRTYNCWPNPDIEHLICIDTVGAVGIPHTGLFAALNFLPVSMRYREFQSTIPGRKVKRVDHAMSLDEVRGPYDVTLMHFEPGDDRHDTSFQTWFKGAHPHLVWNKADGLNDAVLAWLLQKLQDSVGLLYKTEALAARFPKMREGAQPRTNTVYHTWASEQFSSRLRLSCYIVGTKTRRPGFYNKLGLETRERIHPSVAFGDIRNGGQIPGFKRLRDADNQWFWNRTCTRRTLSGLGWPVNLPRCQIDEAQFGPLEAQLLGVHLCRDGC